MSPRKFLMGITIGCLAIYIRSTIVKASDTHACYVCDKDDCEDPVIADCGGGSRSSKCFIEFDSPNNDVVKMGCVVELLREYVQEQIKNKTLYICDGVSCNDYAELPNTNQCFECSSSIEEACATKPTIIGKVRLCNSVPYTQCYQRVNGQVTERGCLHDLKGDEFYKCLTGGDDKCKICEGETCNKDIIPNDRQKCHRCSSKSDARCEISPAALSVCPLYSATDNCVVSYENGIIKRGCQSEFPCSAKLKDCQICSRNGCNTANIRKRFNDMYGIFQNLPLKCNICKGNDCDPGQPRISSMCQDDDYQDCITVFDGRGNVVRRGCENIVLAEEQSHCELHPELCFRCKANVCNNMTDALSYQECLYCDTSINSDCLLKSNTINTTRKCSLGCVTSLYPRKSSPKVFDFVRTCLDDLELDSLDSCTAENHCIKCWDNRCNTAVLPAAGRLSCLHCEGSDCDNPTSKQCIGYTPNDRCYIYFSNTTLSVVRMGCRSDVPDNKLREEIKQFYVCDGDDCNDIKKLPEAIFCFKCDSETDAECAINPSRITARSRCDKLPYTQCFTRIRDGGYTERGCLSQLPTDVFIGCHDGHPDSKCSICTANNCNKRIYPGSRHWCYRCNSSTDINCEYNPNQVQYCPRYQAADACVTQYVNATTRRYCASEVTCEGLSYKNCRMCSGYGCNNDILSNEDIGVVGLFTHLPLRCHACNGTHDCMNFPIASRVCNGSINQSCTTVFDKYGTVVARGCANSLEKACSNEENYCFNCKSNDCNTANKKIDYINCVHCDAKNSDDCVFNVNAVKRTRKCHKSCMTALYPRTKDKNPAYELVRTCLDDKDLIDRSRCASFQDPSCVTCIGNYCNKYELGSRKSCYRCRGDECRFAKLHSCRAVMADDQCFQKWDESGTLVELGCKSQYDPAEVEILLKQKRIWFCDDDNCNHVEYGPISQKCIVCNSKIDARCATRPSAVLSLTICGKLPYTQCYSRVLENGHTDRGCLSNLDDVEFLECLYNESSSKCLVCRGDKCNQELYPRTRLSCYDCASENSNKCESNPEATEICHLYSPNDTCSTIVDIYGKTLRGCSSKLSCSRPNITACKECVSNNCNKDNLKRKADAKPGQWQSLPLTCFACNNLTDCSAGYKHQTCSGSQYCMTVFDGNNEVVQRGCSDVVEKDRGAYCDLNSSNCVNCNSNLCNNADKLSNFIDCIYCDTDDNVECLSNVTAVATSRQCYRFCMTALYPRFNEENPSYGLSRSCYDDMELDDRNSCAAGVKAFCSVCNTTNCNKLEMPEKPISCYICEGDDCQEPQAHTCLTYRPGDKCFTRVDERKQLVALGCLSQLENSEADYLVKEKLLLICNEDNCNSFNNIPNVHKCILCNSRTDMNCAVHPAAVTGNTECSVQPLTSCYTRVLANGATERGCLSHLFDDEFLDCLNGTSTTCKWCNENNCNREIFPESRLMCHVCNSVNNIHCEERPASLSICPLYDSEDTCVTSFVNGVTYRGCSSNLECNITSPSVCQKCSVDGCNNINLAKEDANFGMWQDLPLTCLSCSGRDCESVNTTAYQTCKFNNEQDCMTVFNGRGTVIARGCSDSIKSKFCSGNQDNCYNCKSNKCNWASSKSDYEECVYCKSYKNQDCVWNPFSATHNTIKCHGGCMTSLYRSFNAVSSSYELIRSCLNDKEVSDQVACLTGKDTYCSSCRGNKCNTDAVPDNRFSCFACEGQSCDHPAVKICPLHKEKDQCFVKFDNNNRISSMGCTSSFGNQDFESIIKTKRVHTCFGSNCNSLDQLPSLKVCASCNSFYDTSCATDPAEVKTYKSCGTLPHTSCYTKLTKGGATTRGCLADLLPDEFLSCFLGNDKNCSICDGNRCNVEIYPTDRPQCFTCTSEEEPDCHSFPKSKKACPILGGNESCVTALTGNITIRGCKSLVHCDVNDASSCRWCFGSECNTIKLLNKHDDGYHGIWQELPLKCHTCEGELCLYSLGPVVNCSVRNINQDCMTVFDEQNRVQSRGCSDDVEDYKDLYCRLHPERCFTCKSNECNIAWSPDQYIDCLFCDSAKDPLCVLEPNSNKLMYRKCYKDCMVAMKSQQIIRSCLNDKEKLLQHYCWENDSKECASCSNNGCNNLTFPRDRLQCHFCTDSVCNISRSQHCKLYENNDFCFAKYENGVVNLMGCGSSQNASDIAEWAAKNKLYKCGSNDCNELSRLPKKRVCIACDSSINLDCAQRPLAVLTIEICRIDDRCVSRVDAKGHTLRSCFSNLTANEQSCELSGTCAACTGEKCNNKIFPDKRLQCHICDSKTDNACRSNPSSVMVCPMFNPKDKCVSALQDNKILQRACESQVQCFKNSSDFCDICNTNGCNTIELKGSANVVSDGLFLTLLMPLVSVLGLKY